MSLGALAFANPWLLLALAALPAIWFLLRAVPPQPQRVTFPATRILEGLRADQQVAARSPWWLTLLRMLAATLLIAALAEPVLDAEHAAAPVRGPVVIALDNTWAAAAHWQERLDTAERLIGEAQRNSVPVLLAPTATADNAAPPTFQLPQAARDSLAAIAPEPYAPNRAAAADAIERALSGQGSASLYWLSDGVDHDSASEFAKRLAGIAGGRVTLFQPASGNEAVGLAARLGQGGSLDVTVLRPEGGMRSVRVEALAGNGVRLGEAQVTLTPGAQTGQGTVTLPLELRNQIARLQIAGERSAGAVQLLDAGARWNRVGLVSGTSREQAQPLLSPLYYIERALTPFAALSKSEDSDTQAAIDRLIGENVSILVLADIGKLLGPTRERVERFIEQGGVLVRFAGPRLEQASDDLLPVALRQGGRALGGALSWATPQPLAPFEGDSPFTGLKIPDDVRVNRQVLADPALLSDRTQIWARLQDGTPLVTAEKRKAGWLILFHVTANSDWSNLPLSGLFVEMLHRIAGLTGLADIAGQTAGGVAKPMPEADALAPVVTLDGYGEQGPPPLTARALPAGSPARVVPDAAHPPGLYGRQGATRALNLLVPDSTLKPISGLPQGVVTAGYKAGEAVALKPWLLSTALGLLLLDMLAVFTLQSAGLWRGRRAGAAAALLALALLAGATLYSRPVLAADPGSASPAAASDKTGSDKLGLEASLKTRLAYVITGDASTDDTSRQGLAGLGQVLEQRTAVEPGPPIGVHVETDELAFFPILYWPVTANALEPSDETIARLDAYMKGGGLIIFDTRSGGDTPGIDSPSASPEAQAFRRIASRLDIPRLEPAPADHVLTKSFYLLRSFPGRYDSSPLWVEAGGTGEDGDATSDQARQSDGVSAVLVTGNDLAGAWAIDDNGQGFNAVVPGGEEQREYAFRVGVNIVMYALTGNYKADQVHVPAILERLGQ